MAFTSKYAVSLYENLAQCVNLSMKQHQEYTLDEFRELLGVPPGRYKAFGELNKHVIKPAVDEVNALAPFSVSVGPKKQGKKVVKVTVLWMPKDSQALEEATAEMQRSKVGRRARITGTAEHVTAPLPSLNRLIRSLPKLPASPKTS
jgi:plasmid replication initiation protein